MARKVFYSFHYDDDNWRTATIKNIGAIEGNQTATPNKWEEVVKSDVSIKKWIDDNLYGRSCLIVLVGSKTAGRKWINYEIEEAWKRGMGVFAINIHNIKDMFGEKCPQGKNPFETFTYKNGKFSNVVKCYNPIYSDSKDAYNYISSNIEKWIEEAILIRKSN